MGVVEGVVRYVELTACAEGAHRVGSELKSNTRACECAAGAHRNCWKWLKSKPITTEV